MQPFSNPARIAGKKAKEIYPYYAGFSEEFAEDALEWATKGYQDGLVLDPWNGSGTTTRIASRLGIRSIGFDLNPVMVLVAKAESLDPAEAPVLLPLAQRIVKSTRKQIGNEGERPLDRIFELNTSASIIELARAIWLHVVAADLPNCHSPSWENVAPLAGAYFVALFNSVRGLLKNFATSNPTWLKVPKAAESKVMISRKDILSAFLIEVGRIQEISSARSIARVPQPSRLSVGDSRSLPLATNSVDAVVTSPPYCTRLDYGRSTMPELLILESLGVASYEEARRQLMGAATARKMGADDATAPLGATCRNLLEKIRSHPSKASETYYFQSHFAYFTDLASSIAELGRVMAPNGRACVVVQDSYYKELHNDLPLIIDEMARLNGISPVGVFQYKKVKSMCSLNKSSQAYRGKRTPVEVAMLFTKE